MTAADRTTRRREAARVDAGSAKTMGNYELVCPECDLEKRRLTLAEVAYWSRLHYAATGHIPEVSAVEDDDR